MKNELIKTLLHKSLSRKGLLYVRKKEEMLKTVL